MNISNISNIKWQGIADETCNATNIKHHRTSQTHVHDGARAVHEMLVSPCETVAHPHVQIESEFSLKRSAEGDHPECPPPNKLHSLAY